MQYCLYHTSLEIVSLWINPISKYLSNFSKSSLNCLFPIKEDGNRSIMRLSNVFSMTNSKNIPDTGIGGFYDH